MRIAASLVVVVCALAVANSAQADGDVELKPGSSAKPAALVKPIVKARQFYPDVWGYDYNVVPPSPLRVAELHPGNLAKHQASAAYEAHIYSFFHPGSPVPVYNHKPILDSKGRLMPWYLAYLKRLGEGPFSLESNQSVLRFVWMRTKENPVCVNVKLIDNKVDSIFGKEIVGLKNEKRESTPTLTAEHKQSLKKKIWSSELWKQSSDDAPLKVGPNGASSLWVLESWDGKRYRHVEKTSPKSGPIRELGQELLKLTSLYPENPQKDY